MQTLFWLNLLKFGRWGDGKGFSHNAASHAIIEYIKQERLNGQFRLKNQCIASLSATNLAFQIQLWDELITQAQDTLKMLHASTTNCQHVKWKRVILMTIRAPFSHQAPQRNVWHGNPDEWMDGIWAKPQNIISVLMLLSPIWKIPASPTTFASSQSTVKCPMNPLPWLLLTSPTSWLARKSKTACWFYKEGIKKHSAVLPKSSKRPSMTYPRVKKLPASAKR